MDIGNGLPNRCYSLFFVFFFFLFFLAFTSAEAKRNTDLLLPVKMQTKQFHCSFIIASKWLNMGIQQVI